MEPDSKRFRTVLGHYPTGISVITAKPGERPVGMAVGTFTSVSLEPPLVAFMPAKSSSTWPLIREAGRFCVNILNKEQQSVCQAFSRRSDDKFKDIAWRSSPLGSPIIDDVVAWVDCEIAQIVESGDHFIVIGKVDSLDVGKQTEPLMFFKGEYSGLGATRTRTESPAFVVTEQIAAFLAGSAGPHRCAPKSDETTDIRTGSDADLSTSRETIVREILVKYMTELVASCETAVSSAAGARMAVERLIDVFFASLGEQRAAVILYQNERAGMPRHDESELVQAEQRLTALWERCIRHGQTEGLFHRQVEPRIIYYMIRDAVFVMARWYNEHGRYSLDQISSQYRRTILTGIQAEPRDTPCP
jgi:flavin reductase (DIM6/NTAB) family NADH-FMN oxidoreductase RutF